MSQKIPILLNCIAAIAGAFGQYFYKKGALQINQGGSPLNLNVILGIFSFILVMGLFVWAYRLGGRISVVYPFYATTFLWGLVLGIFLEKEPFHPGMLLGLAFLGVGISLLAFYSGKAA